MGNKEIYDYYSKRDLFSVQNQRYKDGQDMQQEGEKCTKHFKYRHFEDVEQMNG